MSSIGTRGEMVMSGLLKPLAGNGIILLDNRRRKVCAANEPFIIEIMLAAHHMMGDLSWGMFVSNEPYFLR